MKTATLIYVCKKNSTADSLVTTLNNDVRNKNIIMQKNDCPSCLLLLWLVVSKYEACWGVGQKRTVNSQTPTHTIFITTSFHIAHATTDTPATRHVHRMILTSTIPYLPILANIKQNIRELHRQLRFVRIIFKSIAASLVY